MSSVHSDLDAQIEKLRNGDTLAEHEVKLLCDKVRCGVILLPKLPGAPLSL